MRPSVLSIPPGLPFLRTLTEAILAGRIVEGFRPAGDPLALADLTIYVPTRRAARALASEFSRALGGKAAILPAIRPLGEADDAALFLSPQDAGDLTPVMEPLERRMLIARLVRQWKAEIGAGELGLLSGEEIQLPASSADAVWLSADLCTLLDQVENEAASLAGLAALAPDRLAAWWQLTLTFLSILTEHWPEVLRSRGLVDAARAQNARLRRQADRYRRDGSPGPVIVAGSTATPPASVALMQAVAGLANGAVVLPGLDRHLSEDDFAAVDVARSIAAPGHPQYGLKRILSGLLLPREAVDHLEANIDPAVLAREALVSDALRPAETSEAWGGAPGRHPPEALDGLALVEAADEREEALAIAVAMREALSDPAATAALTTPDRGLARRVVAELARFGIAANDSAGRPLLATAPGTLMRLTAEVALSPDDPIVLVSLLKHPLLRLGYSPSDARRAARTLELIGLRGGVGRADVKGLSVLYRRRRSEIEAEDARVPRPLRLIPGEDRALAAGFAERLEAALAPLIQLRGGAAQEVDRHAVALTTALEALCRDPSGDASALYAEEAGAALAGFLQGLVRCPPTGFAFPSEELPDVIAALATQETVKPRGGLSARAFVWGTLEARLQSVDMMILGGLNEGTWPAAARSDAFLSRLMRTEIALDPPERRIGLAAHDFMMALGTKRVVLARSARAGGAPAIASRWLQRLLTVAGEEGTERLRAEGAAYLAHARLLDRRPAEPRATPPAPRPPLETRPTRLSVTEIETLVRDPYAVHAKRILRLEPLPELIRDPGAADRGTLYHRILARFVADGIDPAAADARDQLIRIAREAFDAEALPAEVEAIWWPRMETLADHYIAWERERNARVADRFAECGGLVEFADLSTMLTGYADRIDRMSNGSVEIIDFKTGTNPSVKQARTLLAPQLPLEGAMARLGGFAKAGEIGTVADLIYVRLREREFYEERLSKEATKSAEAITGDGLSDEALAKVRALVAAYRDPGKAYGSRARPFMAGDFSGDYDHLARAREWSVGADGESGGEGE